MPIDDERRRFHKTKAAAHTKPQASVATENELRSKGGVQESLKRLEEMLRLQRGERAELLAGEKKRIEANKQAAQRARSERDEKYKHLQQAFERMKKWKGEEDAGTAREKLKRVQGTNPSPPYLCGGGTDSDEDGMRLVEEVVERYRQQHADANMFVGSEWDRAGGSKR